MQTRMLSRAERRKAVKYLETQRRDFSLCMSKVAISDWPPSFASMPRPPVMVFRSRDFLACFYDDLNGYLRMSVQRVTQFGDGNWKDGITWDDLQRVKGQCGFSESWMVESYPPDSEIVNVANIRHLFLLTEAPPFAWRKKEPTNA
jgi:hypothetical protein